MTGDAVVCDVTTPEMFTDRLRQLRHSEEEIRGILLEVSQGLSPADACRKHGISQQTYYRWRRRFGDESQRNRKILRLLEEENIKLKRLLAEKELELHALRLELDRKRRR